MTITVECLSVFRLDYQGALVPSLRWAYYQDERLRHVYEGARAADLRWSHVERRRGADDPMLSTEVAQEWVDASGVAPGGAVLQYVRELAALALTQRGPLGLAVAVADRLGAQVCQWAEARLRYVAANTPHQRPDTRLLDAAVWISHEVTKQRDVRRALRQLQTNLETAKELP